MASRPRVTDGVTDGVTDPYHFDRNVVKLAQNQTTPKMVWEKEKMVWEKEKMVWEKEK